MPQAAAKKAGNLVKFGGGFYAGKLPAPPKEDNKAWVTSLVLALYAMLAN